MSKKKTLAPRDVQSLQKFRDPSEVVAINTINLSEVQMKTWLAMIYFARNNLKADTHKIRLEELNRLSGYSKKDHQYLKQSMILFCQTAVEFNTLGKSKKDFGCMVTTLLASAHFDKIPGWVEFEFSKMLKKIIINSNMFSNLSLALVRNLETKAGLALYRVVNDYKGIEITPEIPVETLRELLGVDKKEYPDFKAFNRSVLKPACKQVKEKTDLEVIPYFIRTSRKVSSVKFEIKEQPSPLLVKPKAPSEQKKDKKARAASKNPYGHLGNIELLSELQRISERLGEGENLVADELRRKSYLNELRKERNLE